MGLSGLRKPPVDYWPFLDKNAVRKAHRRDYRASVRRPDPRHRGLLAPACIAVEKERIKYGKSRFKRHRSFMRKIQKKAVQ